MRKATRLLAEPLQAQDHDELLEALLCTPRKDLLIVLERAATTGSRSSLPTSLGWPLVAAILYHAGVRGWRQTLVERFNAAHDGDYAHALLSLAERAPREASTRMRWLLQAELEAEPSWREDIAEPNMSDEAIDSVAEECIELWLLAARDKGWLRVDPDMQVQLADGAPPPPDARDLLREDLKVYPR